MRKRQGHETEKRVALQERRTALDPVSTGETRLFAVDDDSVLSGEVDAVKVEQNIISTCDTSK